MSTASMGHQAKLGVKEETTYGTAVTVDRGLIFASESMTKSSDILERDGLRGTRSHNADDTRTGIDSVGGQIVLQPSPDDLTVLFPWMLGTDASGTTYALAETLQSFTVHVDRVADDFRYAGCVVSRWTLSGSQGGLLQLVLDIVGKSEAKAVGYPSLPPSVVKPYAFFDMALTLQGALRKVRSFELTCDNGVISDRFLNSTTIVNAPAGDRLITLSVDAPYANGTGATGNEDLLDQALAGATGTLVLTGVSPYVTTFTFATLQAPSQSPNVGGRGEIMLPVQMVARQTGSTKELVVTHVVS